MALVNLSKETDIAVVLEWMLFETIPSREDQRHAEKTREFAE